jgi:hypothetical protein
MIEGRRRLAVAAVGLRSGDAAQFLSGCLIIYHPLGLLPTDIERASKSGNEPLLFSRLGQVA